MIKWAIGKALDRIALSLSERINIKANSRDDEILLSLGQLHALRVADLGDRAPLRQAEFKVFSQWGEDGIIQYLINKIEIRNKFFVEFGVENYRESNTRFLLEHNNWRGLVMDGSERHIKSIQNDPISWRHHLTSVAAFITAENINELIAAHVSGNIGLLSIDIDGNDYWAWKAISVIQPWVVICEYNSLFGSQLSVTTPYKPDFQRNQAHYSNLYAGASLQALCNLAEEKGYVFAGSESSGTNAFFVRRDVASRVQALTVGEGYVELLARESRDESGALTYVSGDDRLRLIQELPLVDLKSGEIKTIRELFYAQR